MSPSEALKHLKVLARVASESDDAEEMRKLLNEMLAIIEKAQKSWVSK